MGLQVTVVPTGAAALDAIKSFGDGKASVYSSGSTTLQQIGFTAWVKSEEGAKAFGRNIKGEMVAAWGTPAQATLAAEGAAADVFITTPAGIAATGEVVTCGAYMGERRWGKVGPGAAPAAA
jgi:hypothetical protein